MLFQVLVLVFVRRSAAAPGVLLISSLRRCSIDTIIQMFFSKPLKQRVCAHSPYSRPRGGQYCTSVIQWYTPAYVTVSIAYVRSLCDACTCTPGLQAFAGCRPPCGLLLARHMRGVRVCSAVPRAGCCSSHSWEVTKPPAVSQV